jgi:hypothetical protein
MTTEAQIGLGTEFWLGNNATPSVLTRLGEILSVTPPNPQTAEVEGNAHGFAEPSPRIHFRSDRRR